MQSQKESKLLYNLESCAGFGVFWLPLVTKWLPVKNKRCLLVCCRWLKPHVSLTNGEKKKSAADRKQWTAHRRLPHFLRVQSTVFLQQLFKPYLHNEQLFIHFPFVSALVFSFLFFFFFFYNEITLISSFHLFYIAFVKLKIVSLKIFWQWPFYVVKWK